jgi:hypothetical protein
MGIARLIRICQKISPLNEAGRVKTISHIESLRGRIKNTKLFTSFISNLQKSPERALTQKHFLRQYLGTIASHRQFWHSRHGPVEGEV